MPRRAALLDASACPDLTATEARPSSKRLAVQLLELGDEGVEAPPLARVDLDDVAGAHVLAGQGSAGEPSRRSGGLAGRHVHQPLLVHIVLNVTRGADGLPDAAVQLDVLLAVGAHADDGGASAASARSSAARNDLGVGGALAAEAVSAAASAKSRPWGVAMWSTNASPSGAAGRKSKIPPPSLSISTITSFRPRREAASSPPMSWASATSPSSSTTGPRAAAATPNAVETVPSIRSRRGWRARGTARRAPGRRSRRRGPASRRRRPASPRAEAGNRAPRRPAARSIPVGPTVSAIAPAAARSAACQRSSQLVSRRLRSNEP